MKKGSEQGEGNMKKGVEVKGPRKRVWPKYPVIVCVCGAFWSLSVHFMIL